MTCVLITNWGYGVLGVAIDYESAIDFLIKEGWLIADDRVSINYDKIKRSYPTVQEFFDNDWKQELSTLGIKEFNKIFLGKLYLEEVEIHSKTS